MTTETHPAPPQPYAPDRLHHLLDALWTSPLPSALCAVDRPSLPVVFANEPFARLTGRTAPDFGARGWDHLETGDGQSVALLLADAVRNATPTVIDAVLARPGAASASCRLYVSAVPETQFLLVQAVETGIPGTASSAETLLRDLRHRVMNHLQFIQSVLHMQSQRVDSEPTREALRDIAARIDTLAVVYRQLYASRTDSRIELAGYLGQLVSNLSSFYDREGRIILRVDGPDEDLLLPVERAFPLGLIVTELVVNSFKHAFRGRSDGTITIAVGRPVADEVQVAVRDNGPGLPESGDAGGGKRLGLTLVRSLAGQIGGTVAMPATGGTHIVITLPLGD